MADLPPSTLDWLKAATIVSPLYNLSKWVHARRKNGKRRGKKARIAALRFSRLRRRKVLLWGGLTVVGLAAAGYLTYRATRGETPSA